MKLRSLTLTDIARIGLFLDDPYGDGIRIEYPWRLKAGRVAAQAEIRGEPVLDGERLILEEYEARVRDPDLWTAKGTLRAWLRVNITD